MAEAKVGDDFIKHEFDEAIAIQERIVEAERQLSREHPFPDAQQAIKTCLNEDQRFLKQLQQLGKPRGATGEVEDVAGAMGELMQETLATASEAESEAYEAHAVLLSLKRKQQDSGAAMVKIARELGDADLRDAAVAFEHRGHVELLSTAHQQPPGGGLGFVGGVGVHRAMVAGHGRRCGREVRCRARRGAAPAGRPALPCAACRCGSAPKQPASR